jgi:hypothetical protein
MLKAELIALVAQQRAEISRLQTQLAAQAPAARPQAPVVRVPAGDRSQAMARLRAAHPNRKSFTAAEVCAAMA